MSTFPPPRRRTRPPPKKGLGFGSVLIVVSGLLALLLGPPVVAELVRQREPVPDTSARPADLRNVMPTLLPEGATSLGRLEVSDVTCEPLAPAQVSQVLHLKAREEQVELVLRRQMAELRWRDLPDRSSVGPTSVTMRYEHGIGDEMKGTVTYLLRSGMHGTTVRVSLVGSIRGRCGVR